MPSQKLVREFYNYKLTKDDTIEQAWTNLKSITRKIVANNPAQKDSFTVKLVYTQLLTYLPLTYDSIRDTQRQLIDQRVEELLARLQEKESDLKERKSESAQ